MSCDGYKCYPISLSNCKQVKRTFFNLNWEKNDLYLRFSMATHSICAIHSFARLRHYFIAQIQSGAFENAG